MLPFGRYFSPLTMVRLLLPLQNKWPGGVPTDVGKLHNHACFSSVHILRGHFYYVFGSLGSIYIVVSHIVVLRYRGMIRIVM